MRLRAAYPWPGNVRELGAVIDRAATLGDGERLEVARALGVGTDSSAAPQMTNARQSMEPVVTPAVFSPDEATKGRLKKALAVTQGRIEGPQGAAAP